MTIAKKRRKNDRVLDAYPEFAGKVLSQLEANPEVSESDLLGFLGTTQFSCYFPKSLCKNVRKENYNCFCGMLPLPGSHKKQGLWAKYPDCLSSIFPDLLRREDNFKPCGLKNLGNTCYVNSALQCLFMIPSLRTSLFGMEERLAEQPILKELRDLFLHLHVSPERSIDTASFAKCLNLDHKIQQDCQEFFKLLLTKVEGLLSKSGDSAVHQTIPTLFRGSYSNVTICKECRRASAASSRETEFYELTLQVQGLNNLVQSLATYLALEEMCGPNQYACAFCDKKVDATRQVVLRKLPSVLCFALQRFVWKSTGKHKASDKFTFPLELDVMDAIAVAASSGDAPPIRPVNHLGQPLASTSYELTGIILHKGTSASHGHYVAHLRHPSTGSWWRCDDEVVDLMGTQPSGFPADHGTTAAAASSKGKGDGKRPQAEAAISIDGAGTSTGEPLIPTPSVMKEITSANAYLLVYRLKDDIEAEMGSVTDVPEQVLQEARAIEAAFEAQCETLAQQKKEMLEKIEQRQATVRGILEASPVVHGEPSAWLSTAWLEAWAHEAEKPAAIDNSVLTCYHGKMDPHKVSKAKRISWAAWQQLMESHGGGPELKGSDLCRDCIREMMEGVLMADEAEEMRDRVDPALAVEDDVMEVCLGERSESFYVSKTWVVGWKKRAKAANFPETSPTAAITCPHGNLVPSQARPSAKRVSISGDLWHWLKLNWTRARKQAAQAKASKHEVISIDDDVKCGDGVEKPQERDASAAAVDLEMRDVPDEKEAGGSKDDDVMLRGDSGTLSGEGPTGGEDSRDDQAGSAEITDFPTSTSEECPICLCELGSSSTQDSSGPETQRKLLHELVNGLAPHLEPHKEYYVIPREWVERWRKYVLFIKPRPGQSAAATTPSPPEPLHRALAQFVCTSHSTSPALTCNVPALEDRRGRISQADVKGDAMRIITPTEWLLLQQWYGPEVPGTIDLCGADVGAENLSKCEGPSASNADGSRAEEIIRAVANGGVKAVVVLQDPASQRSVQECINIEDEGKLEGGASVPNGHLKDLPSHKRIFPGQLTDYEEPVVVESSPSRAAQGDGNESVEECPVTLTCAPPHSASALEPRLVTRPPVCLECCEQQEQAALVYSDALINVDVIRPQILAAVLQEKPGDRRSRRTRRSHVITVCSFDTIAQLKLKVAQVVLANPDVLRIYQGLSELSDSEASLAQCRVFPGAGLKVVVPEDAEGDLSWLDSVADRLNATTKSRELEVGFTKTALLESSQPIDQISDRT